MSVRATLTYDMLIFENDFESNVRLCALRFLRPQQSYVHLFDLIVGLNKHEHAIALLILFLLFCVNRIILAIGNAFCQLQSLEVKFWCLVPWLSSSLKN